MEKRIKIIWALSLSLALLAIGVQGFLLFNQYTNVVDTYTGEIAKDVLNLCEQEYEIRKSEKKTSTSIIMQRSSTDNAGDSVNHKTMQMLLSIRDNIRKHENDSSAIMTLRFDSKMPADALEKGAARAVTEINSPFRLPLLDSLMSVAPSTHNLKYNFDAWTEEDRDTTAYSTRWEKTGSLLHPSVGIFYAYSPLEKKGIIIRTPVPVRPVFGRMAIQLLLALGMILMLLACLIFQIKTILKQKKTSEIRESFVNTMIHELRRPVQTLKAFLALLSDEELSADRETVRKVVQDSMFETDNLSAYLNKLRDIIRTDSEITPLHIVKFDVRELVGKVVRLTPTSEKEVSINISCSADIGRIQADPVHIANMLSNLIENAVKYSGQEVRIEIKVSRHDSALVIAVTDNGIGIPQAEQEKVFLKFFRASNIPDKDIPGLGLGLSYVKLIAEAHRGTVCLDSKPGRGTAVSISIPQ